MLNTNTQTAVNEIPSSVVLNTVQSYVEKYRGFGKKSATNIVEMAQTFIEAQAKLGDTEFKTFCAEVDVDKKGSTFRKLKAIGGQSSALLKHVDKLPCDWTTLYFLATVAKQNSGAFEAVFASTAYKPGVSLKVIKKIAIEAGFVDKKKKTKAGSPEVDSSVGENEARTKRSVSIILDNLEEELARQLCLEIESLRKRYNFKINPSAEYKKLSEPHSSQMVH